MSIKKIPAHIKLDERNHVGIMNYKETLNAR